MTMFVLSAPKSIFGLLTNYEVMTEKSTLGNSVSNVHLIFQISNRFMSNPLYTLLQLLFQTNFQLKRLNEVVNIWLTLRKLHLHSSRFNYFRSIH